MATFNYKAILFGFIASFVSGYFCIKLSFSVIEVDFHILGSAESSETVTIWVFWYLVFQSLHCSTSKQICLCWNSQILRSLNITVFQIELYNKIGFIQFFTCISAQSHTHNFHLYSTHALGFIHSSYASKNVYVAVSFLVTKSHVQSHVKS